MTSFLVGVILGAAFGAVIGYGFARMERDERDHDRALGYAPHVKNQWKGRP